MMVSGDVLSMTLYMEAKLLPNTISRNTVAELVGTSQPDKVRKFLFWSGIYSFNLHHKLIRAIDVLIAKYWQPLTWLNAAGIVAAQIYFSGRCTLPRSPLPPPHPPPRQTSQRATIQWLFKTNVDFTISSFSKIVELSYIYIYIYSSKYLVWCKLFEKFHKIYGLNPFSF